MKILKPDAEGIAQAVELLRQGQTVGMPTETVYGLAGDARNPDALRAIFAAKGRPIDHPLIVHIGQHEEVEQWAQDISDAARRLAAQFWPGPLTLVLKRRPEVSDLVTGGQDTVAIRMPDHPVALALLRAFGGAVCAPSANRFGRISPTHAVHVYEELQDRVTAVIDGGACRVGIESTIVDVSGDVVRILRPGHIRAEAIAACCHVTLSADMPTKSAGNIRVPGALDSHYAPITPAYWLTHESMETLTPEQKADAFLLVQTPLAPSQTGICLPSRAEDYAMELYEALRQADKSGKRFILVAMPPDGVEWEAVRNRLLRACVPMLE